MLCQVKMDLTHAERKSASERTRCSPLRAGEAVSQSLFGEFFGAIVVETLAILSQSY